MLTLISTGPGIITVNATSKAAFCAQLSLAFNPHPLETLGVWKQNDKTLSIIYVTENNDPETAELYAFEQRPEVVMSHLVTRSDQKLITDIHALPPLILFNGLGDISAVINKLKKELPCHDLPTDALFKQTNNEGTIVVFLKDDSQEIYSFYEDSLLIDQEYSALLTYLRIHAPRYLAKAFAPNAWHMVDLRVFDRYEAYTLQYDRLVQAIKSLKLGYIVTETWNREVSVFKDPVGTYQIRLLTFMEPLELKKLLIGLEYSQSGDRMVDLDLFWHNRKISWKDVLDDQATRKKIKQTDSFFPKSSFFAVQSDKLTLVKYCLEEVRFRLPEADKDIMRTYEKEIRLKSQDEDEN